MEFPYLQQGIMDILLHGVGTERICYLVLVNKKNMGDRNLVPMINDKYLCLVNNTTSYLKSISLVSGDKAYLIPSSLCHYISNCIFP